MRIVHSPNEFADSFLGAQREAAASFGTSTILLEKYITKPRHIEVQVPLAMSWWTALSFQFLFSC